MRLEQLQFSRYPRKEKVCIYLHTKAEKTPRIGMIDFNDDEYRLGYIEYIA